MKDLLEIAQEIENKIHLLEKGRATLEQLARDKADAIGEYRKQRAIVLMKLRNGEEFELDGVKIKDPPVSVCEGISRGICYKEKIEEEKATALYKNGIVKMEAVQAELCGYQSMNRHLSEK